MSPPSPGELALTSLSPVRRGARRNRSPDATPPRHPETSGEIRWAPRRARRFRGPAAPSPRVVHGLAVRVAGPSAARGEEGRDLLVLGVLLFRVDDLAQRALEDGDVVDGLDGHGRAALLVRLLARAEPRDVRRRLRGVLEPRAWADSTSLQREFSARARSGKSIYASRPFREMIARPKISRNEWKTAEI